MIGYLVGYANLTNRCSLALPGNPDAGAYEPLFSFSCPEELRLIFTCCHPALAPEAHVALSLREVCGLTTEEIAKAFLITPRTLA
jgi:hypothetical protein